MATEYDYNKVDSIIPDKNLTESVVEENQGELQIPLSDRDFYLMTKSRMDASKAYWDKLKISAIRDKNIKYWLGKQDENVAMYDWQTPYLQNIIFRNTETLIANALGRIPSVVIIPGSDTIQSRNNAQLLQRKLRREINNSKERRKLRQSLRHLLLMRLGAHKVRWDDKLCGGKGDYVWEFVHPDDILVDHTTYLGNNPSMVVHFLEEPLKVIIAKFPKAKEGLFQRFNIKQGTERQLDTIIRYPEIHFTYFDDNGNPQEGLGWRYEDIVFDVIKAPYYDYEGVQTIEGDITYHNYFESPKKPFVFFNFLSLGKNLMDDITLVEQNALMQDNVNKRGRQITQQSDTANGKWVFSSDFINKAEAEKVTDDPQEHIIGKGDVSRGAVRIPGQAPNQTLFLAQQQDVGAMDDSFGTHSPMRGGVPSGQTATSDVLSKEGDTTRVDDLVSEALELSVQDICEWSTHMMKLFYTEEHYVKDLGSDGKILMDTLSRDAIEDGLEVVVKASTTDHDETRTIALELVKAQLIDPLSLFEDLDKDDPKERARRVLLFSQDPVRYQEEILGTDAGEQGKVKKAIDMLTDGQIPQVPESVTEEYLAGVADFIESDTFKELDPKIQANVMDFVGQLQQKAMSSKAEGSASGIVPTVQENVDVPNNEYAAQV